MSTLAAWYYKQMAVWSGVLKRDAMALEYWRRLRAERPLDATVVATIAHLRAGKGHPDEAIALMHQALELDPRSAVHWFNLGYLQQERGAHEPAVGSFERAIEIDEKLDRAHYGKGLSLVKLGKTEEAIDPFRKNCELQPLSPYGWYQLAHVYHRLGDSKRVANVIKRLAGFEPRVAKQLERETGVLVGVEVPF